VSKGMSRRELLAAASASFVCGCASIPRVGGGGAPAGPLRTCDHDLCRYWRRDESVPFHPEEVRGEYESGRCALGLPEALK
jgi:hypothetical protein